MSKLSPDYPQTDVRGGGGGVIVYGGVKRCKIRGVMGVVGVGGLDFTPQNVHPPQKMRGKFRGVKRCKIMGVIGEFRFCPQNLASFYPPLPPNLSTRVA